MGVATIEEGAALGESGLCVFIHQQSPRTLFRAFEATWKLCRLYENQLSTHTHIGSATGGQREAQSSGAWISQQLPKHRSRQHCEVESGSVRQNASSRASPAVADNRYLTVAMPMGPSGVGGRQGANSVSLKTTRCLRRPFATVGMDLVGPG